MELLQRYDISAEYDHYLDIPYTVNTIETYGDWCKWSDVEGILKREEELKLNWLEERQQQNQLKLHVEDLRAEIERLKNEMSKMPK